MNKDILYPVNFMGFTDEAAEYASVSSLLDLDQTVRELRALAEKATPGVWHLASLNDGLFIIDKTPPAIPGMVLNVTDLPMEKAQAVVDAHNGRIAILDELDRRGAALVKAEEEDPTNLGWFIGLARKHGHHVQADWLEQYRAALSQEAGK